MFVKRRSLAQARRAAGFTQESLAERLGVDRTTVARWESGEYSPQPWLRPKIAEAFGVSMRECCELLDGVGTTGSTVEVCASVARADGVPLTGSEQMPAVTLEHEQLSGDAELAEVLAGALALQATAPLPQVPWEADQLAVSTAHAIVAGVVKATGLDLAEVLAGLLASVASFSGVTQTIPSEWEDRLYDQLKSILGEWAEKVDRRKLLRLLGWAATVVAATPVSSLDADEQERLVRAIALPSRVDGRVIDHIEGVLQYCKRQEDALGPRAVLHSVFAQRELVDSLLGQCSDELRPRLLSVYSSMSSSVGFYCFDLDGADSAMRYCDQGRAAAQEARNTELAVYALCNMSYFASWQGKAHAGIDFAAAAQSLARKTDDVLLQVCAAERAGTAYAVDGQYTECMNEFDVARAGMDLSGSMDAFTGSPESPAYWYHEGLIASQQSDCLLRLGKPREAVVSASEGLQLFDSSFVGSLAFCTLRLGTAHLQCGEVEEAARVVGDGAVLTTQNRSARLTREVRAARARMEPWKDTRAVRELDELGVGVAYGLDARASGIGKGRQ
ncbi:MAG: helix-turn-helix transcriptional regulator [Pseudonocardiaceae bacterium]